MPNYAQFPVVTALPVGRRMGQTVMLRQNGMNAPYIYQKVNGVNQWAEMPCGVCVTQDEFDAFVMITAAQIAAIQADPRWTNARPTALPMNLPVRVVTANTTIVPATDYTIAVKTTGGAITVTLPAAPANGDRYEVRRITGTNQCTINRNGNNVDGQAVNPTVAVKHTVTLSFISGWGWSSTDVNNAI